MTVRPSAWFALAAALALSGVAACGSNEPSGTTPVCNKPDASDCFTLPDGGPAPSSQPEASTGDDASGDGAALGD